MYYTYSQESMIRFWAWHNINLFRNFLGPSKLCEGTAGCRAYEMSESQKRKGKHENESEEAEEIEGCSSYHNCRKEKKKKKKTRQKLVIVLCPPDML